MPEKNKGNLEAMTEKQISEEDLEAAALALGESYMARMGTKAERRDAARMVAFALAARGWIRREDVLESELAAAFNAGQRMSDAWGDVGPEADGNGINYTRKRLAALKEAT